MAISKITGQMLNSNLDRLGTNLAIDGNLFYFDVTNRRVGINTTTPTASLDIVGNTRTTGNARVGNIVISGNTVTTDIGYKLNFGNVTNLVVTGGSAGHVITTDGNGSISFASVNSLVNLSSFTGNAIPLGINALGSLVSNATNLSSTTTITDGLALVNQIVGKLVPLPPQPFPGGQSIALTSSTTTARMANFVQTDNTGLNLNAAAGSTVSVVRSSGYATSQITTVGPGDSGNVKAYLNNQLVGSRAMTTGVDNGTYGHLIIANDQDYHNVVPSVSAGFYQSFDTYLQGTAVAGWNEVHINDTATAANTNSVSWYYDASTPGTPFWSNTSISLTSNAVTYSSTIPHLTSSAIFTIKANVANLSGDMYPTTDTFVTGSAAGAFATPASVTYSQARGITTPLARNLYVGSGSAYLQSQISVISEFGSSSAGPSLTAINSYNSGTNTFSTGATVLYKTGTSNQIEETALTIGAVGIGSGAPYRITGSGSTLLGTDTPAYSGVELAFNSQTTTLLPYDATVVAAVLKNDTTNYSTGYIPVGPNLSTNLSTQYFTFRFQRTGVSKFDILYSGTLAGLWIACPGSLIDSTSSLNGWIDASIAYNGAGIPGALGIGNLSNGCSVGGPAVLNSAQVNKRVTVTLGTVSSSDTANNYIYVRVKLTTGQSLTALQIQPATH